MARDQGPKKIATLEALLCLAEDYWFMLGLFNRLSMAIARRPAFTQTGMAVNAPNFRRALLNMHRVLGQPFDLAPFMAPNDVPPSLRNVGILGYPPILAAWTAGSRQTYNLIPETQAILEATTLRDLRWRDVQLPFSSFAMKLSRPLISCGKEHDFIVVSMADSTLPASDQFMTISAYGSNCADYVPVPKRRLEELARLADQGKTKQLKKALEIEVPRMGHTPAFGLQLTTALRDTLVEQTVAEVCADMLARGLVLPEDSEDHQTAVRLVVGLSVYVQTAVEGHNAYGPRQPLPDRAGVPNRRAITAESEICQVNTLIDLTPRDRVLLGLEGGARRGRIPVEMEMHYRRAHSRRPPGQGNNPEAEKTVKIPWTIVRSDRMPPDAGILPGGRDVEL